MRVNLVPSTPGGAGGGRPPFANMERDRGIRYRRLERMVARKSLKHGAMIDKALRVLDAGMDLTDEPRERRLSAEASLSHFRDIARPSAVQAVNVSVQQNNQQQLAPLDFSPMLRDERPPEEVK